MSSYNFNVYLDFDLAKKMYMTEMTERGHENLTKIAGMIIKRNFGEGRLLSRQPYKFVENEEDKLTCLLQYCDVPGDATGIGIDGMDINSLVRAFKEDPQRNIFRLRGVTYSPHNIDTINQAYTLLSIWLNWINLTKSYVEKKSNK